MIIIPPFILLCLIILLEMDISSTFKSSMYNLFKPSNLIRILNKHKIGLILCILFCWISFVELMNILELSHQCGNSYPGQFMKKNFWMIYKMSTVSFFSIYIILYLYLNEYRHRTCKNWNHYLLRRKNWRGGAFFIKIYIRMGVCLSEIKKGKH